MIASRRCRGWLTSVLGLLPRSLGSRLREFKSLQRFVSLAAWSMVAFALEKGAQSVTIILLAKVLGAAEYGRLTLAQGMVNTAQLFVVLGAGTILARYIPAMLQESARRAVEIINLCVLVVFATAAILVIAGTVGSSAISVSLLELPPDSSIPYWITGWVIFTGINGLLLTIMLSFEKGHVAGIVSLAVAVPMIIIVPLSGARWGFHGAVIALVVTAALKAALFLGFYFQLLKSRGVPLCTRPRRSDAPLLLSFGLPVFLSSALWAPTMWLAQLILKELSPMGLAAVGLFGFCNNIFGLVVLISSVTNRASLPILSSVKTLGEDGEVKRLVGHLCVLQVFGAIVIGAPIILFSSEIMTVMGGQFAGGGNALIVMVVAGVVISGQQPLINLLLVNDRAFANLFGMVVWSGSLLVIAVALVDLGALGVAYAVLAAAIVKGVVIAFMSSPGSGVRA